MDEEVKQLTWLVDDAGVVTQSAIARIEHPTVRPIKLRSSGELHARARLGLIYISEILKKCGWYCNCVEQSSTSISFQIKNVCIDVAICRPDRIAYITSYPGYEYKAVPAGKTLTGQQMYKPTAKVTLASDLLEGKWVVRVISNVQQNMSFGGTSAAPIYIPVNNEMGDPAKEVARNVFMLLKQALGSDLFELQKAEAQVDEALSAIDLGSQNPELSDSRQCNPP